jgi:hypothetical protein
LQVFENPLDSESQTYVTASSKKKVTISVLEFDPSLSYDITAYFDTERRKTRRKEMEKRLFRRCGGRWRGSPMTIT